MLVIKNGRVIDPATHTDAPGDILIDGGKIAEVAEPGSLGRDPGREVFDATGLVVAPGFVDLHAHLREPGQESSETIETGTRAAARGGFTVVCSMPNTNPVNDKDRKSTRLNSSHQIISYAVFCLKKKKQTVKSSPSSRDAPKSIHKPHKT